MNFVKFLEEDGGKYLIYKFRTLMKMKYEF